MPAPRPHVTPPLPPVRPAVLPLPDGSQLQILPDVPDDAAGRRTAVRDATLYCIAGRLQTGHLAAYVGLSAALHSGRAASSYTNWVIAQKAIAPVGMGLLRRDHPYPPDQLRVLESMVMRRLCTDMGLLALTNRQTTAQLAAARLTPAQTHEAAHLADQVAEQLWHRLLDARTNPWPAPAPNAREQAVRIVLRAGQLERRALDTEEVTARLLSLGHQTTAQDPCYSTRRDLEQREPLPGSVRIRTTWHRHRRLYFAADIPLQEALTGYDRAHPSRRPRPRPTRPAGRPATRRPQPDPPTGTASAPDGDRP